MTAPVGAPGVDYGWARPNPSSLHSWGYRFACRYLSHDAGKNLSAAEAQSLLAAGIDVVLNWESTADSALGGAPAGTKDGEAAQQQAIAIGAPSRAAVYFSVDFDAQPNQYATIAGYLDAARKQLGGRSVGVYGGKSLVDAMVGTHADLGWQTLAWSYGQMSLKAAIYQDRVNITLPDGSSADHNRILRGDYGGWSAPVPAPPTEDDMAVLIKSNSSATIWATDGKRKRKHTDPQIVNELASTGVYGPESNGRPVIHTVSDKTLQWLLEE